MVCPTHRIPDRLVKDEHGIPVVGATVETGTSTSKTDTSGHFTLGASPGKTTVVVRLDGYIEQRLEIAVGDEPVFGLEFALRR